MTNEFLFILHTTTLSACTLGALYLGKEALYAFIALCFVLANLFVLKQITLFGYNATCADAFIIAISIAINILQEYYGKSVAQKAIWVSLAASIFYMIASLFHLAYFPASFDTTQTAFLTLLAQSPRLIIASLTSYTLVQYFDTITYGILFKKLDGKYFVLRNYFSMLSSQLFDTVLFSFLGLYGIVHSITEIIIVSYTIKAVNIILTTPFLLVVKSIKK
ncbi:hypothetical protein EBR77_01565 [bacterium]|nr:hypothetical protein [bacterium]NBX78622.1 hypothetical protein [bacterium]